MGFDNIGFGKLLFSYLGGIRDDIASGYLNNGGGPFAAFNQTAADTTIADPHIGGLYLHTIDARIHDINILCGQLELIGDFQFLKGGYNYTFSNQNNNTAGSMLPLNIGDTPGFRVGAIYYHPSCPGTGASWYNTSFWEVAAIYGYGASELFGTDPLNQNGTLAGYNLNRNLERINNSDTISSGSLRRASQFRAIGWSV